MELAVMEFAVMVFVVNPGLTYFFVVHSLPLPLSSFLFS
tara:strand:+ start:338 stop:454 length:117 start_codon:yes stop_codon:yes gene_type:complete